MDIILPVERLAFIRGLILAHFIVIMRKHEKIFGTFEFIERNATITLLLFVNCFFSILKRSFFVGMPFLPFTIDVIGTIASASSVSYGFSKTLGSIATDVYSAKTLLCGCLFLGSLCNLLFSLSNNVWFIGTVWALNGIVQGVSGPALLRLLSDFGRDEDMGKLYSILTAGGNVGYLVTPFLLLPLFQISWELPFYTAGSCGILLSIIVYWAIPANHTKDKPLSPSSQAKKQAYAFASLPSLLINPVLICCMCVSAMTYFSLKTYADWTGMMLIDYLHFSQIQSTEMMLWGETGGLLGSTVSGFVSDAYFRGNVIATSALFSLLCIAPIYHFIVVNQLWCEQVGTDCTLMGSTGMGTDSYGWITASGSYMSSVLAILGYYHHLYKAMVLSLLTYGLQHSPWHISLQAVLLLIMRLCFFVYGVAINGPKTLHLLIPRNSPSVDRNLEGTAQGIISFAGQMGGSLAGSFVANRILVAGWQQVPWLVIGSSGIMILALLICLVYNGPSDDRETKEVVLVDDTIKNTKEKQGKQE